MAGKKLKGRVLSVASECVPLIKTGGLADVVGALPAALAPEGWEMKVLLPAYRSLRPLVKDMREVWWEEGLWGGEGRVYEGEVKGLRVMLLDAPHLFDRDGGPYAGPGGDWWDNAQRFAALSWIAVRLAREGAGGWKPDILHAHDWQAGFAPAYLKYAGSDGVGSVITIHNIAFQGWAAASQIHDLRLPADEFYPAGLEYFGGLSSLKAGLVTADRVTAVSPSYATELLRPEYGMGMQGVIASRAGAVSGILNGVDTSIWSPEREEHAYSMRDLSGKMAARAALCESFSLEVPGPLAIVVSRLTDQKGIDLLVETIPDFIEDGGGVAVLGSGDRRFEAALHGLAARFPGRVGVRIGYDEGLSHRMFAGGDAVLVPSRFEPCGLTQLYGLRYGTLPVVAETGGLADTVINANEAALSMGVATGLSFHPTDAIALGEALKRLIALYADKRVWMKLMKNAMKQDVSWAVSARAYAALYASIRAGGTG